MIEILFKIGDQVRINPKFDEIRHEDDPGIADEMLPLKDNICTIADIKANRSTAVYIMKENGWAWSERWLIPVNDTIIKDIQEAEFNSIFMGDA